MSSTEVRFPFSVELKEQHAALRSTIRWLESEVDQKRGNLLAGGAFLGLLHTVRTQLGEHFLYEERNGFEGGFGSPDPEVQASAGLLVRQHRDLERTLDEILGRCEAEERFVENVDIAGALLAFFKELRRHDAFEDALLQRIVHGPTDV